MASKTNNDIYLMLGDHNARLLTIESTVTQTSADVKSLMTQFHTDEGGKIAHRPYLTWVGRATSTLAAGLAGAWSAVHFGVHK